MDVYVGRVGNGMACAKTTPKARHDASLAKTTPKARNLPIWNPARGPGRKVDVSIIQTSPTQSIMMIVYAITLGLGFMRERKVNRSQEGI
jgi:hypothetical protein